MKKKVLMEAMHWMDNLVYMLMHRMLSIHGPPIERMCSAAERGEGGRSSPPA